MANDKISAMTAAVAGDFGGTTSRFEFSTLFATAPATLGITPALMRTVMFAGGGTYTGTDPITAGAASFTTLAASSTLAVTGAATLSSTLAVTGTSTLTGNVAVGTTINNAIGLNIKPAALTGATQYGAFIIPSFTSAATANGRVIYVQVATAASAFTMTNGAGLYVDAPSIGAGSAITNLYGVYIAAQSGATTLNIGLYNGGTTTFVGALTAAAASFTTLAASQNLTLGSLAANPGIGIRIGGTGAVAGAGVTAYGLLADFLFPSGTTTSGQVLRVQLATAEAAFTMVTGTGIYIDAPSIGATSAITNVYGLYIVNQTGGGTLNYAIRCNGGQVNLSLPTSAAGLAAGSLWANSGIVTVA